MAGKLYIFSVRPKNGVFAKLSDRCFRLKCNPNKIMIDFIPHLFGLHKMESENPFGKSDCIPRKRDDTKKYHWSSSLGQCGMTITSGRHSVKFEVKFSTDFS